MLLPRHLVSVTGGDLGGWMSDLTWGGSSCVHPVITTVQSPLVWKDWGRTTSQPSVGTRLLNTSSQQGKAAATGYKSAPLPRSVPFHLDLQSAFYWQKLFPASTKYWMLYVPEVLLVLEYGRPSLFTGCCTWQAPLTAEDHWAVSIILLSLFVMCTYCDYYIIIII